MMRVRRIEPAEGVVPGLYDVEFDDGSWAHDLTIGQVMSGRSAFDSPCTGATDVPTYSVPEPGHPARLSAYDSPHCARCALREAAEEAIGLGGCQECGLSEEAARLALDLLAASVPDEPTPEAPESPTS